jgi:hypothetical protein
MFWVTINVELGCPTKRLVNALLVLASDISTHPYASNSFGRLTMTWDAFGTDGGANGDVRLPPHLVT